MKSGIYKILNLITGKFYIGSAKNLFHRWKTHEWLLINNRHGNRYLQAAYDKYGPEAFQFEVLEYCELDVLLITEQHWINWTGCCNIEIGYNLLPIAGSPLGTKRTDEQKKKSSERMKGFKHNPWSIAKMRQVQSNKSEEHRKNISLGKMGHPVSEETRKKIGDKNRGRIQSEEEIAKRKLYIPTKETKVKIALTHRIKKGIKEKVKNMTYDELAGFFP